MLVAALACALQAVSLLATPARAPRVLTVRAAGAARGEQIPLVTRSDGQLAMRADLLAAALGGRSRRLPNGHFALTVPGATLELVDQSGFATSWAGTVPLPAPAWTDGPVLYIPLAIVADVLPRVASGVLYDPARQELRLFRALPPGSERHAGRRQAGSVPDLVASREPAALPADPGSARPGGAPPATDERPDVLGVAPSGDVLLGNGERERSASSAAPDGAEGEGVGEGRIGTGHHRLVVVDAGHGGPDKGMTGPIGARHPVLEKDITLAVALDVGAALRRRGIDVLQTRTRDTLIALSDRGRIANAHHGDLFLSIHVNAANPAWHDPAGARGFETYFLAEARTEDARRVEEMENAAVRFETGANAPQHDPLNFIINDMAQNEHLRESAELADMIQRRLASFHPGPDRGVKQAGFRVLVTAYMPAVLVEIGFGTNAAEAHYLTQPASQRKIADAIAGATAAYLARYERRVSAAGQ